MIEVPVHSNIYCSNNPNINVLQTHRHKYRYSRPGAPLHTHAREAHLVWDSKPVTIIIIIIITHVNARRYIGNQRSMLLPNTIFRMGAAAVLLSNKPVGG
jgi:hypothetical protein